MCSGGSDSKGPGWGYQRPEWDLALQVQWGTFRGLSGEARHSEVSKGTHWVSLGLLSGRLLDTVLTVCLLQLDLEWSVAWVEWDLGVHQHQLDQLGEIKVHCYICLTAQTELKLLMHLVFLYFKFVLELYCLPFQKRTRASSDSTLQINSSYSVWNSFCIKMYWHWPSFYERLKYGCNMGSQHAFVVELFFYFIFFKWLTVPAHGTSGREKAELSFILEHTDIKPAQPKRMELEFIQRFY